jgi:hypothetical protein
MPTPLHNETLASPGRAGILAGSAAVRTPHLARKLRLHDYFALAFGTMIGTGSVEAAPQAQP